MRKLSVLLALAATLAAGNAFAREWQIFGTFSGRPAGGFFFSPNNTELLVLDFDGDGVPDNTLIKSEAGSRVLVIIGGADPTQRWQIPLPSGIIAVLIGFMDLDGVAGSNGAVKEILLAEKVGRRYVNPVVLYNIDATAGTYEVKIWDQGTILIGGWDINNDGIFELIISHLNNNEVEVWVYR